MGHRHRIENWSLIGHTRATAGDGSVRGRQETDLEVICFVNEAVVRGRKIEGFSEVPLKLISVP